MPSLFARTAAALFLVTLTSGCYGGSYHGSYHSGYHHAHIHSHGSGGAVVAGFVAGVAIASVVSEHSYEPPPPPPTTVVYVSAPAPAPAPPPPAPPREITPKRAEPGPFDAARTRAALAAVDVSGCEQRDVYGHAQVYMNPDGYVSKVIVDEPANLSPAVAQCIGDALGTVTVPPFRGSFVVVGTTFRMHR